MNIKILKDKLDRIIYKYSNKYVVYREYRGVGDGTDTGTALYMTKRNAKKLMKGCKGDVIHLMKIKEVRRF